MPNANIVEIYYTLDEFSKLFDAAPQAHGLKLIRRGAHRGAGLMSDTEMMTILVLFHTSGCRTLKAFYLGWVCTCGRTDFPRVLSYSRFEVRQQQVLPKLLLFLRVCAQGRCTDISIVDSTLLAACHSKRAAALHQAGLGGARLVHHGLDARVQAAPRRQRGGEII